MKQITDKKLLRGHELPGGLCIFIKGVVGFFNGRMNIEYRTGNR